jgi:hypothetical protein
LKFIATEPKLSSSRGNNVNGVSGDAEVIVDVKMGVHFFLNCKNWSHPRNEW